MMIKNKQKKGNTEHDKMTMKKYNENNDKIKL